jgi:DNA repair protein RadC
MKDRLPSAEMPRERLLREGSQALSLVELLAILLRTGNAKQNVIELSETVLSEFGGLDGLFRASLCELLRIPGIKNAKACSLVAALELARRASLQEGGGEVVSCGERVAHWSSLLAHEEREFVVFLSLDRKGAVIDEKRISYGGLDGAFVDVQYLLRRAVRLDAKSVVLLHNHPDGSLHPSAEDRILTRHVRERLMLLSIGLQGHYIVAKGRSALIPSDCES